MAHLPLKTVLSPRHQRLGHIDEDIICKMVCMDAVTRLKVDREGIQDCSACWKGKQTWNIIPHSTHKLATEVLGWVFSDVCGPVENSTVEGYTSLPSLMIIASILTSVFVRPRMIPWQPSRLGRLALKRRPARHSQSCALMVEENIPHMHSVDTLPKMVLNMNWWTHLKESSTNYDIGTTNL